MPRCKLSFGAAIKERSPVGWAKDDTSKLAFQEQLIAHQIYPLFILVALVGITILIFSLYISFQCPPYVLLAPPERSPVGWAKNSTS